MFARECSYVFARFFLVCFLVISIANAGTNTLTDPECEDGDSALMASLDENAGHPNRLGSFAAAACVSATIMGKDATVSRSWENLIPGQDEATLAEILKVANSVARDGEPAVLKEHQVVKQMKAKM